MHSSIEDLRRRCHVKNVKTSKIKSHSIYEEMAARVLILTSFARSCLTYENTPIVTRVSVAFELASTSDRLQSVPKSWEIHLMHAKAEAWEPKNMIPMESWGNMRISACQMLRGVLSGRSLIVFE